MGFLCGATTDGRICESRRPQNRSMLHTFPEPGGRATEEALLGRLNAILGYAHGAGLQTRVQSQGVLVAPG